MRTFSHFTPPSLSMSTSNSTPGHSGTYGTCLLPRPALKSMGPVLTFQFHGLGSAALSCRQSNRFDKMQRPVGMSSMPWALVPQVMSPRRTAHAHSPQLTRMIQRFFEHGARPHHPSSATLTSPAFSWSQHRSPHCFHNSTPAHPAEYNLPSLRRGDSSNGYEFRREE